MAMAGEYRERVLPSVRSGTVWPSGCASLEDAFCLLGAGPLVYLALEGSGAAWAEGAMALL
jgi:hypothetical protein